MQKTIRTALISVYHKDGLSEIVRRLKDLKIEIYSTGGTQKFIEEQGVPVTAVEDLTSYPSILGGRVKTLHPKIFGGILSRREEKSDTAQLEEYEIPAIDLVIVDLYPFEETVKNTNDEKSIIEKIDIGGISLIRAAAKNFKDVLIIPSREDYAFLQAVLDKKGETTLEERKKMAAGAFAVSSGYDTAIFNYFNNDARLPVFRQSYPEAMPLRYGENPHQQGAYFGSLEDTFERLNGKELSYNNLVDIDAAVQIISEFDEPTFAILKHTNTCGLASRSSLINAWKAALAGDPISAFGGILICNTTVNKKTASEINNLFFEVIIAPGFDEEALDILKQKKNRIILKQKQFEFPKQQFKSLLNGVIQQDKDLKSETTNNLQPASEKKPSLEEIEDLLFANKAVKHLKSNAIALVKNKQLIGIGTGQTSRVDALKQAIEKAKNFNFDLKGAVMASDAFFPFPDCVEIAYKAGITAVIQPGGSVKDKDSIDYCNSSGMAMVFSGTRHFKH